MSFSLLDFLKEETQARISIARATLLADFTGVKVPEVLS
jgi:hypothetical protein